MEKPQKHDIHRLAYLYKTLIGIKKMVVSTKNRLGAYGADESDMAEIIKGTAKKPGLENFADRVDLLLRHQLERWPIWTEWLVNVKGVGARIASALILGYYYKMIPTCKKCGADLPDFSSEEATKCASCGQSLKGEGRLQFRLDDRTFPTISKWWAFCGRGPTADGMLPKKSKGSRINWSPGLRVETHLAGEQFVRQGGPYRAYYESMKAKHVRKNETREKKWTPKHIDSAAKHETAKLFLSHFWAVARQLDGLPVSEPYAHAIMGHTNYQFPPFGAKHLFE